MKARVDETSTMTSQPDATIALPPALLRRLEELASRHERSVEDIVRQAIELHYDDDDSVESARSRLVDRLARLEAGLGDAATLQEQVAAETRRLQANERLGTRAIPTD